MERPLSRRAFTKRVAATLGGLSAAAIAPLRGTAKPKKQKKQSSYTYWVLDPNHAVGTYDPATDQYDGSVCELNGPTRSCQGCNACHSHADNKLFATDEIPDSLRAHEHCRCRVVEGGTLPHKTWTALFGPHHNPQRLSVDRRHHRTQTLLEAHGS